MMLRNYKQDLSISESQIIYNHYRSCIQAVWCDVTMNLKWKIWRDVREEIENASSDILR